MRKFLIFFVVFAHCSVDAQVISSDGAELQNFKNLQKYWNMRHRFLGDNDIPNRYPGMIEIGPGQGKSIPSDNRRINEDNSQSFVNPNYGGCDGGRYHNPATYSGALFWGDGTIWMGDYITMLATEWKLLDSCGSLCDDQKSKTELELYYALITLDRLDYFGEMVYGLPGEYNGFLARDDVPNDFYENFGKFDAQGNFIGDYHLILSSHSDEELCPTTHSELNVCDDNIYRPHPKANAMSQDQAIGIIYGLSFVAKLIPSSVVVSGISLKEEAQLITTRIVNYIKNGEPAINSTSPPAIAAEVLFNFLYGNYREHWTVTDPSDGAFVCRGPYVIQFSYPLAAAAEKIAGTAFQNAISTTVGFSLWAGINAALIANKIPIESSIINATDDVIYPMCFPEQDVSFCDMGLETTCNLASMGLFSILSGLTPVYCDDLASWTCGGICDLGILDDFCTPVEACSVFDDIVFNQFNLNMIFKLAASSGTWTPAFLGEHSMLFRKEIYDLAGAVLNGYTPYSTQSHWENNVLNVAPCNNPCYNPDENCDSGEGWRAPQRWDKYLRAKNGYEYGRWRGEFNGIDYMVAYNLYRLAFPGAGGSYLPLIDRSFSQTFPYNYQGNQYGNDARPLTIQAASLIEYNGKVLADGNVTLIAGKEIEFGPDFEVELGGEFDSYYDYMQCEPNYFDLGTGTTAVLRTGNPNADNRPDFSNTKQRSLPENPRQPKKNKAVIENSTQSTFTISPNPNNGRFLIQSFDAIIESVEISNILGETVHYSANNIRFTEIDISSHPRGVYFVKLQSGDETVALKIIYQ